MQEGFENKLGEAEVVELMTSSASRAEWDRNCQKVRQNFSGVFPSFWKMAIIDSGIAKQMEDKWAEDYSI